jgi:hypothetical protein
MTSGALAEKLVAIAQDVTEPLAVLDALDRVREIANTAKGERRALAEVAEAFLRVLARGHAGREALAVHRFLKSHPKTGHGFLRETLTTSGLFAEELKDGERLALIDSGVLTQRGERLSASLHVTQRARVLVRDASDPLLFRLWTHVESARAEAINECLDDDEAVEVIAGRLGCTLAEARDHLHRWPL